MSKERNIQKIDFVSTELTRNFLEVFEQHQLSTKDGIVVIIAAIGKFLQIFSHLTGCDRFLLFKAVSDGIIRFYNSGGDDRLDAILAATDESVEQDKN